MISPRKLFESVYSLRGKAAWLTEYQSERADPQKWGTGLTPCHDLETPYRMLAIQMVIVDCVTFRGPRQFGWADTKSALTTLVSWLYLSLIPDAKSTWEEVKRNHLRIRQFAKTIVGGMCRRDGSYQEIDDNALGPLEDWLRQCLVVPTARVELELSDREVLMTIGAQIEAPRQAEDKLAPHRSGMVCREADFVPSEASLRSSLEARVRFKGFWMIRTRVFKLT